MIYPLYKTINSLIKKEYKCWYDKWVMLPEDFWLRSLDLIKSSSDPTDDVWDTVHSRVFGYWQRIGYSSSNSDFEGFQQINSTIKFQNL